MWHYGDNGNQIDEALVYKTQGTRNDIQSAYYRFGDPLSKFGFKMPSKLSGHEGKIKECIKTLSCIA